MRQFILTIFIALIFINSNSIVYSQIPTNGLVAYYPFNGNANDESGSNLNGTVYSGVTWSNDRFNVNSKAALFNGTSSGIIEIADNNLLDLTRDFSICFWSKCTFNYNRSIIISKHTRNVNNDGSWFLSMWSDSNKINFENLNSNPGNFSIFNKSQFDISNWNFVVFSFNKSTSAYTYYINGTPEKTGIANITILNNSNKLLIGNESSAQSNFFSGLIDDIRIYNHTINESEIDLLYHEGGWSNLNNGLVAYYPFNGNANDMSGNRNNGTVSGVTFTNGQNDKAARFTSTSYVEISDNSYLNFSSASGITIEAWVKQEQRSMGFLLIKMGSGGSEDDEFSLLISSDGQLQGAFNSPYTHQTLSSKAKLNLNTWYNIVLKWDQSSRNISFYNNGVLDNSTSSSVTSIQNTNIPLRIGKPLHSANSFIGLIDEIRIFNRTLTETEIQTLYNENSIIQPPVISDFNPKSGIAGSTLTITGSNFNATPENNVVYFGGVKAVVNSASSNSLTVTVPVGATYQPITVTNLSNGLTAYSIKSFSPTFISDGNINQNSFDTNVDFTTGNDPLQGRTGDIDGDGKIDIVLVNRSANTVFIYRNTSSPGNINSNSFSTPVVLSVPNASDVALADVDGDGKLDIVVNLHTNYISIFKNISTSGTITIQSFESRVDIEGINDGAGIKVQDLDSDGKPEIVTLGWGSNKLAVIKNNCQKGIINSTSFSSPVLFTTNTQPIDLIITDLDGDGKPDIATSNQNSSSISIFRNLTTQGIINSSSFAQKYDLTTNTTCVEVAAGDLDNDGKMDLLSINEHASSFSIFKNTSIPGSLSFNSRFDISVGSSPRRPFLADLDGDSKLDIIIARLVSSGASVHIFRNISTMGVLNSSSFIKKLDMGNGGYPHSIMVSDFDSDSKPDLAVVINSTQKLSVYRNKMISPIITVTSPNGGENWLVNSPQNITWTSSGIENVKIEYTTNNGTSWVTEITSTPASAGSYAWIVPNSPSTLCKVRISDASNAVNFDESEGVFTIYEPINNGLVAYYPFNGNTNDESGNGLHISNNEANLTTDRNAKANSAYYFDGSKSYMLIPDPEKKLTFDARSQSYSVSYWINLSSKPNRHIHLITDRADSGPWSYYTTLDGSTNDLYVNAFDGTNNFTLKINSFPFVINTWYHLVQVYSERNVDVYINGSFSGRVTHPSNLGNTKRTTDAVTIGAYMNSSTDFVDKMHGKFDDLRIYNRAITAREVDSLYHEGGWPNLNTGLVAYYPFNGNADDESGNGNNGINSGAIKTKDRFGNLDRAFSFNGIDSEIDIGNLGAINSQTISIWFKKAVQTGYPSVYNEEKDILGTQNENNQCFRIGFHGAFKDKIVVTISDKGSTPNNDYLTAVSDKVIADELWHQLIVIREGNNIKYYIDGSFYTTNNSSSQGNPSGAINTGTIWKIGRNGGVNENTYFNGNLDDIRIYNRVLSEEEVEELYHEGGWPNLNTGLVAYYPFNDNANDESGNGNNGINHGAIPASDRFSIQSNAYDFSGENKYIEIPFNESLSNFSELSISTWIKVNSSVNETQTIIGSWNSPQCFTLDLTNETTANFVVVLDNIPFNIISTNNITPNLWTHLSAVYTRTQIKIYINGILDCQLNVSGSNLKNNQNIIIGAHEDSNDRNWFNGSIDDIRIYNRALSVQEIIELYHEGGWDKPLLLISPNGGENWKVGSQQNITWASSDITNVKLEYTTNGTSWNEIINSTPASSGTYLWTVPNIPSMTCKVRITDVNDAAKTDISDNNFTIYKPTLTLLSPNGGENWQAETDQSISWTSSWVDNIKIEYTTDNGSNWNVITSSIAASASGFVWKIPDNGSRQCRVRITDLSDPLISDSSDNVFTIKGLTPEPPILVTPANNTQSIPLTVRLIWHSSLRAESYRVQLAEDEQFNTLVINDSTLTDTSCVLQNLSLNKKYYWHVSAKGDHGTSAFSEVWVFTTINPTLIVKSPNGGEIWQIDTPHDITWTSKDIGDIKIEYTTDGSSWLKIADTVKHSSGSYSWLVPKTPSMNCKIKLTEINNPSRSDESDLVFTITETPPPSITVISPNGGEVWQAGTTQNIRWNCYDVDTVKIELMTDGSTWKEIIPATKSDSSYEWIVDNVPSANCKIKVSDKKNSTISDISDNYFTILPLLPDIPVLSSPADKSEQMPLNLTLEWVGVSTADSYELQLAADSLFSSIIINETGISGASEQISGLLISTTYYWRVRAVNAGGISDYSDIWSFTTINPTITVTSPVSSDNCMAGRVHTISWTNNLVNNIKIEFSSDNGNTWKEEISSVSASSGNYNWTVPSSPSVQCKIKISDVTYSEVSDESDVFAIFSYPTQLTISRSISFPEMKQSNFRMIGLPGNVEIPVSSCLSGTHGTDWYAFYDNGVVSDNPSDYQVKYDGSGNFNFKPGHGFWVISKNGFNITQAASTVTISNNNTYSIPLHSGWNIISNPFEKKVAWSKIQALNNSIPDLISDFQGSYSTSNSLEPYKGYYFYNRTNLSSLKILYNPSGLLGKESLSKSSNSQAKCSMLISLMKNNNVKSSVIIGISKDAKNNLDDLDQFAPPGEFEDCRIYLKNENLETAYKFLAEEFKSDSSDGKQFNIRIKSPNGHEVSLIADGSDSFINKEVYFVDKTLAEFHNLKVNSTIKLKQTKDREYFVLIGEEEYIKAKKEELQPKDFYLYQNYPNPFNPVTTIRFALPKESNIMLVVYNTIGERIQTLFDGIKSAGYHEITFDGSQLSSGVYFYSLEASSLDGKNQNKEVKKMLMVK